VVEILKEVFIKKEEIYLLKTLTIKLFMKEIPKKDSTIHNSDKKNGNKINTKIIKRNVKTATRQSV
jgi:hypothetical protein